MKFRIRPYELKDLHDVNEMRRMRGVFETITTLPTESVEQTEAALKEFLQPGSYMITAEADTENGPKVVGNAFLVVALKPRLRHSAFIGLTVHTAYQKMGIGRAMMEHLLDIADNWLMLKRVELEVLSDNERAVKLYESLGFETEGRKKYSLIYKGALRDTYVMGRYRNI